jgi:fatty-acyl-CoA synthase
MLRTIQQEAVTVTWGPAILWRTLLAWPEFAKYDVRSVRLLGNGGMAMTGEMREKLLARFSGAAMMDIYGMTELSPAATLLRPEAALEKPLSVGTPMTLTDVRILDWRGREAAVGEVGEIAVRGNALDGYYKMPEETGQAVKGGFFRTGDLGKRDEEGFITLVDRKRDVITTGGEQVYSREVEEVLQANPRIKESAVIGVPDEKWGERVVAIVSLRQETTPEALLAWCRENLAAYKCPRQIHIVNDIPRNAAGKVVKGELRKRFG